MKVFNIDANEHIQVEHAVNGKAKRAGRHFTSEQEWARIAADLPMAQLVGMWNALPGVTPVERFTSRAKAAQRIWRAIEDLEPTISKAAPQPGSIVSPPPHLVHEEPTDLAPRDSKKKQIIALLKVDPGVSIEQLVHITGWQKHSVRGFLSGTMRKKMGLKIVSSKDEHGARIYRIAG